MVLKLCRGAKLVCAILYCNTEINIARGKKWDKTILCEICVGPTGHISDKTSMTQHVKSKDGT